MGGDDAQPSLGLKWCFPFTEELIAETSNKDSTTTLSLNEREYFEERRKVFQVDFKKEPPKAQTQAFEVSILLISLFRTLALLCLRGRTGGTLCRNCTVSSVDLQLTTRRRTLT